jgi:GNAT superfamily N-acetyltransferase
MLIQYLLHEGSPNAEMEVEIFNLYREIFHSEPNQEARERLTQTRDLLVIIAFDADRDLPVGFKIGYRQDPDTFYSWLGGVLPDYRRQGIAAQLMLNQHEWVKAQGYRYVQTKSLNRWREMIALNLRHGFSITGTYIGKDQRLRIIMEKEL